MSGLVYLGLRTALGEFHRRRARPRPVPLIVPPGVTSGASLESQLVRGDHFNHPELGPVRVVGVERWAK